MIYRGTLVDTVDRAEATRDSIGLYMASGERLLGEHLMAEPARAPRRTPDAVPRRAPPLHPAPAGAGPGVRDPPRPAGGRRRDPHRGRQPARGLLGAAARHVRLRRSDRRLARPLHAVHRRRARGGVRVPRRPVQHRRRGAAPRRRHRRRLGGHALLAGRRARARSRSRSSSSPAPSAARSTAASRACSRPRPARTR